MHGTTIKDEGGLQAAETTLVKEEGTHDSEDMMAMDYGLDEVV